MIALCCKLYWILRRLRLKDGRLRMSLYIVTHSPREAIFWVANFRYTLVFEALKGLISETPDGPDIVTGKTYGVCADRCLAFSPMSAITQPVGQWRGLIGVPEVVRHGIGKLSPVDAAILRGRVDAPAKIQALLQPGEVPVMKPEDPGEGGDVGNGRTVGGIWERVHGMRWWPRAASNTRKSPKPTPRRHERRAA